MQTDQETLAIGAANNDSPPATPLESEAAPEQLELAAEASQAEPAEAVKVEDPALEKRRIEEQLEALKRREAELRRALATASHPELADAIRLIEGRAFALSRAEAKLAQGLSKSEERRQKALEKKRGALLEKRAELDAQIAELDGELTALGSERTAAFEQERAAALRELIATLGEHGAALAEAGLDASHLVPELAGWLPEIEATAERLANANAAAN